MQNGARVIAFERIGSTNAEALARARAGEEGPLWITAERQSAGRGRRGRTWVSEPGNLFATLLLTNPSPSDCLPQLPLVAALAVRDALVSCAPGQDARFAVKWPNDLLLDGRKVAGILVEGETVQGRASVAVGIGVNCRHHPGGTAYGAIDLMTAGLSASPNFVFAALAAAMDRRLSQWQAGRGFAGIRGDWLSHVIGLGEPIRIRMDERELLGVFESIDQAGCLILHHIDGRRERVSAGDVFPLAMPAAAAR